MRKVVKQHHRRKAGAHHGPSTGLARDHTGLAKRGAMAMPAGALEQPMNPAAPAGMADGGAPPPDIGAPPNPDAGYTG